MNSDDRGPAPTHRSMTALVVLAAMVMGAIAVASGRLSARPANPDPSPALNPQTAPERIDVERAVDFPYDI